MIRVIRACATAALATAFALLSGCSSTPGVERVDTPGAAFQGHVQGGQQPVTGSTLQLYAVGTAGDHSAATPLLTKTVTTSDGSNTNDSNANAGNNNNALPAGAFTISGDYTCPSSTTEVYLVATGGNPGLGSGTNNKAISMMAALGQCGQLGSSTYVFVDEVTTVGSIAALYPYMTGYATVGSGTSDATAFASAFSQVNEFTNTSTGLAPGPALPAGYYASSTEINTLADITAACINSAGGTAGDGTACGTLFQLTKPAGGTAATDIVASLVQLLTNPSQNAAAIFNIGTSFGPFQPTLTSAPSSWSLLIVPVPGTPTFSPAAGTYVGSQSVTISDSDPTAVIYYTTNGTTPTTSSTVYSGAFTVSSSETVEALAVESSRVSSAVGTANYNIVTALPVASTPTFSPAAGTYTSPISVTIGDATTGATIYYTTNGSTPTTASSLYTGPISVSSSATINAIAVASGYTGSLVGTAAYTINNGAGIITTIAGTGTEGYSGDGGAATSAAISTPYGSAIDSSGNVYFSDEQNNRVRKVSTAGVITTYAGNGVAGFAGDGGQATSAEINHPEHLAFDSAGNLYIADEGNARIRKVTPGGIISTVAGNGTAGFAGDGGAATSAELYTPTGVVADSAGNLYIADFQNQRVRKVTAAGIISTYAGTGTAGFSGDGGAATSAALNYPIGLALDAAGNLYIADQANNRVRKVTSAGIISTVAGNGTAGYYGDGLAATSAELDGPWDVTVDGAGNLYIADCYNARIRKVSSSGTISTVAGTGVQGYGGDGGVATSGQVFYPTGIAIDSSGNLYIADYDNYRLRKVTYGAATTAAATPAFSPAAGTYSSAQTVSITSATSGAAIYYTTNGATPTTGSTLYTGPITVPASETIEAIAVATGYNPSAVGSAAYTIASSATLPVITSVSAIAAQQTQTITITGSGFGTQAAYTGTSNDISLIDATKGFQAGYGFDTVTLVVSSWTNSQIVLQGFAGAYGQGTYYLSSGDAINLTIYNVQSGSGPGACNNIVVGGGATTCIAGQTPSPTFSVAGGSYSAAQLVSLSDTVSGASIYYTTNGTTPTNASTPYTAPITVSSSETIEAIAIATGYTTSNVASATYTITSYGIMSTFAGTGVSGYSGDGGPATSAQVVSPYAVAIDSAGNIYTADYGGNRVRKITPAGIISTFAGTGAGSSTGDGGLATSATLNGPNGVALDSAGNVYIGEEHGARVRKVTTAGIISTVAGNGTQGYSGDGGPATSAQLTDPENITVDASGNLYIADTYGNRIRKVNTSGTISTFAGTGTAGYNGDNIAATSAQLSAPYDVIADTSGNVYISDTNNNRVRKVSAAGIITTIAGTGTASFGGDGGAATSAYINGAIQISMDTSGNLFIADQSNHRIRKVNSSGIISTIAGNGVNGYSGDGGPALAAEMKNVEGVVTDPSGNVYIGDGGNSVLRKITYQATAPAAATPTFSPVAGTYTSPQSVTITSATSGATIYYTTNGSTPTTGSTLYTGAIAVAASETLEAIAVASGYANSAVGSAVYTISNSPVITNVSAIVAQQTQTFTITGTGLGTLAAYSGTNPYIVLHDVTNNNWSAGYSVVGDTVGFAVSSWTNTQIVITGFTGSYGGSNTLNAGDNLLLQIYNPQTGYGPGACSNIVVGGGATTCTH